MRRVWRTELSGTGRRGRNSILIERDREGETGWRKREIESGKEGKEKEKRSECGGNNLKVRRKEKKVETNVKNIPEG